jgi:polysaccharide pyruvyl transferase WcaK-like protein
VRREILVTADPALLLQPEPFDDESLPAEFRTDRPLVGMSVREPGSAAPDLSEDVYHQLLANAADYMVDRFGAEVVFVPMERGVLDMQHSHAVIARMLFPQRAAVLKGEYRPGQVLSLLERLDFAVGMRLHFLILAALAGVPFVALPYAGKVGGFLDQVGVEAAPSKGSTPAVSPRISTVPGTTADPSPNASRALPRLQERARDNQRLLLKLLAGNERT